MRAYKRELRGGEQLTKIRRFRLVQPPHQDIAGGDGGDVRGVGREEFDAVRQLEMVDAVGLKRCAADLNAPADEVEVVRALEVEISQRDAAEAHGCRGSRGGGVSGGRRSQAGRAQGALRRPYLRQWAPEASALRGAGLLRAR